MHVVVHEQYKFCNAELFVSAASARRRPLGQLPLIRALWPRVGRTTAYGRERVLEIAVIPSEAIRCASAIGCDGRGAHTPFTRAALANIGGRSRKLPSHEA